MAWQQTVMENNQNKGNPSGDIPLASVSIETKGFVLKADDHGDSCSDEVEEEVSNVCNRPLQVATVAESLIAPVVASSVVTVVESSSRALVFTGINEIIVQVQWNVGTSFGETEAPESKLCLHHLDFSMRDITITCNSLPTSVESQLTIEPPYVVLQCAITASDCKAYVYEDSVAADCCVSRWSRYSNF